MQNELAEALLVSVFRAARSNRRVNLTAFCERRGATPSELAHAMNRLEERGMVSFGPHGEQLTFAGLAVAAALSRRATRRHRPLVSCRPLAASTRLAASPTPEVNPRALSMPLGFTAQLTT
jgi:hypothetical protein